jgi:hypothetical protein
MKGFPLMKLMSLTAAVLLVLAALLSGCGTSQKPPEDDTAEQERIEQVLTDFFLSAFGPSGRTNVAYELLSQVSQESCPRGDFQRMSLFGRQALLFREPELRLENIEIQSERATVKLSVSLGNFTTPLFPPDVTLVREGNGWRILITTDPTCQTISGFFDLRERPGTVPGREVTPVSEGNPKCDPAYPFDCIPSPPPYLECANLEITGFAVWPPDPHGFDTDGDGFGCEDNQPSAPSS